MKLEARAVFSFVAITLAVLVCTPLALAQRAPIEERMDQRFTAIMGSVRPDQPQAQGVATILLPSPRFFPLVRFMYVRVEADGVKPNSVDPTIHIHGVRTDAQGNVNQGCFGNDPVVINLSPLVTDDKGHGVSTTRVVLNDDGSVNTDGTRQNIINGVVVNRASITRWYVQFHIFPGEPGAGSPLACGEITLPDFDRGVPFQ